MFDIFGIFFFFFFFTLFVMAAPHTLSLVGMHLAPPSPPPRRPPLGSVCWGGRGPGLAAFCVRFCADCFIGFVIFFPFVIRRCVLGENVKIIVRYYEVDE